MYVASAWPYLHECIGFLDLHALDFAVVVKIAFDVPLPHSLHVEVDYEKRLAGLGVAFTVSLRLLRTAEAKCRQKVQSSGKVRVQHIQTWCALCKL